jgi:hypothetical protein
MAEIEKSTRRNVSTTDWTPGSPIYGSCSIFEWRELVHLKILSDRREQGHGIAYILRFSPPPGKIIKVIAVAQSDEHIYILEGGPCNKKGEQIGFPGDYALNSKGKPHAAFIAEEMVAFVLYAGEPDEIKSFEVVEGKLTKDH